MKNKKLNKILIPMVVLIWLAVMFRFFGGGNDEGDFTNLPSSSLALLDINQEQDSFTLYLNYRDPFLDRPADLGMEKRAIPTQAISSPALRMEKIIPQTVIKYPQVNYLGGVKSENDIRGLIQIDGRISQVKEGEEVAGVKILELNLNQIIIQFKDSTWTARKEP